VNRRDFLIGSCAASAGVVGLNSQQKPEDRDIRVPQGQASFPEDQHPVSERGQELAKIARSIRIERDIEYVRRPERSLKLDVYTPSNDSARPWPVILNFAIAAWYKDVSDYRLDLETLPMAPTANIYPPVFVPHGYAVVGAQVRSSLEARFPAQIHDCQAAFNWILMQGPSRGFDTSRIGLLGASATGQLVSLLALMKGEQSLLDPTINLRWPLPIKAVCSFAGFYDFVYYFQQDAGDQTLEGIVRQYLGGTLEEKPEVYRQASPQYHLHSGAPAFFMDHGMQDRRVPYSQAIRFHAGLQKAHDPVEFEPIDHYHHGPLPGDIPNPPYTVTDRRVQSFFDKNLKRA
jgi:acetyl esterase/lipase